jgi:hypothetical protein
MTTLHQPYPRVFMMSRFLWMSVALLVMLHSQHLLAHGTPVVISTPGGKLAVDRLLYANLTEDDVIDNAPLPLGPNLQYIIPGFDITGMVAGNELNIELLPQTLVGLSGPQYLSFWSPMSGLSIAPNNQTFRVVSAFGQVTAFQDDTPVPPALKVANVTNGFIGVHTHFLNYYLDNYVNAAAGLYALQVRLTSPQYQSSDPFWMMFDYNITGAEVVTGSNAILAAAAGVSGPPTWIGASGDNWTAGTNWTGTVPNSATAEAQFTTTGGAIANLNIDQTVNKLTFDATTSNDYTLSGPGKLTLAGTTPSINTTTTNTGDQTVAVNLDLAAGTTITVNGGSLSLNPTANSLLGAGVTATVATGATLNLGGTANALSDGTSTHANVTNSGTLAATTAGKRVGNITGTGTTNVNTTGASLTASSIRQGSLAIGAGNTVTVAPNGTSTGLSRLTSSLSIAGGATPTGTLDLKDNDLIVGSANLTAALATQTLINEQVEFAYNGFAWDQPGITSSTVQNDINVNGLPTALGILLNNDGSGVGGNLFYGDGVGLPTFNGQTIGEFDTLVKYTWLGDADLNGLVDSVDFGLFQAGFDNSAPYTGWAFGDFDYNGVVDSVDFGLFQTGLGGQTGTLLSSGGGNALAISAIPEPGTWVLGGLGLLGLASMKLRRRRA